MLLQIDDTYVPISNIVAMKKANGNYAVSFWSPRQNGEPFLRTVLISGEALYELESWLSGQIVVKLANAVEIGSSATASSEAQRSSPRKSARMPAASPSRRSAAEPQP